MVAMNYQVTDQNMAVYQAMFSHNGLCGYVFFDVIVPASLLRFFYSALWRLSDLGIALLIPRQTLGFSYVDIA